MVLTAQGLVVISHRSDLTGDAGHPDSQVRRCVQCRRVIDPVILQNRRVQVEKNMAGLISAVKLMCMAEPYEEGRRRALLNKSPQSRRR